MKALVVTQLGKTAEVMDWPMPDLGDEDVLIKTRFSGVSMGTEMAIASGLRADYGPAPFVNGYQATGVVVDRGKKVAGFADGDRVAVYCRGAHSEYVRAAAGYVHRLPVNSGLRETALFVQPSVAANALNQAAIQTGEDVLVVGQGLIGQCAAILARLRGARVFAAEIAPARRELSARYCADEVIDPGAGTLEEAVKARLPEGAHAVFESSGLSGLVEPAMACCRNEGRFIYLGWYADRIGFAFNPPHQRQLRFLFPSFIGPAPIRHAALRLLASEAIPMAKLITHEIPWNAAAATYTELLEGSRASYNGIVVNWGE